MRLFIILFYIVVIWVLCSCSGAWHLRKAMKKSPELFDSVRERVDTVLVKTPPTEINHLVFRDTTVYVHDTITNTRISYRISKDCDSIQIECEPAPAKIITKTRDQFILVPPTLWDRIKYFVFFLIVFLVVTFLVRKVKA